MITKDAECMSITDMVQLAVNQPCPGGDRARARIAVPAVRAPRLWRELALIVAFYAAYTRVRLPMPHDETAGYAHVTLARRPLIRALAALYLIVTIMVIFSTANHYVLDAIAGIAITGVALGIGTAVPKPGDDSRTKDHKVTNKTTVGGCSPHSI